MLAIGGLSPRILAIGGFNIDDGNLKTIEAWDDEKKNMDCGSIFYENFSRTFWIIGYS